MPGSPDQPPSRSTDRVPIDDLLSGGNPRTLRNVDQVVETVLADPDRLQELTRCILASDDQVEDQVNSLGRLKVRMRAGDALEKVCRAQPPLIQPHVPLLLGEMAQPCVQWHVAQMLGRFRLTTAQRRQAARLMDQNLDESSDWIVLDTSLDTLAILARTDPAIVEDLCPRLRRQAHSHFKSLANRARKLGIEFGPGQGPPTAACEEGQP
jgi:hypothetical protein